MPLPWRLRTSGYFFAASIVFGFVRRYGCDVPSTSSDSSVVAVRSDGTMPPLVFVVPVLPLLLPLAPPLEFWPELPKPPDAPTIDPPELELLEVAGASLLLHDSAASRTRHGGEDFDRGAHQGNALNISQACCIPGCHGA